MYRILQNCSYLRSSNWIKKLIIIFIGQSISVDIICENTKEYLLEDLQPKKIALSLTQPAWPDKTILRAYFLQLI